MENISLLILGRHSGMLQNVIAFLNSNGFASSKGVLTNEAVKAELLTHQYRVLIIGGGVDAETRTMIMQFIAANSIKTKTVEHYGNPATLIEEIKNTVS